MEFLIALWSSLLLSAVCSASVPLDLGRLLLPRLPKPTWNPLQVDPAFVNKSSRIIGGQLAGNCQFPYQVSLQFQYDNEYSHVCGGSLITPNLVLSAAHCAIQPAKNLRVLAGTNDLNQCGAIHQVAVVKVHEDYDPYTLDSDVALFWLKTPVRLHNCLAWPVKLPKVSSAEIPEGAFATVSGWGATVDGSSDISPLLRYVYVPRVNRSKCESDYGGDNSLASNNNMICFGLDVGGQGFCDGDSGSPLVRNNIQYGIVVYSEGCARPGLPGIYVDVIKFVDWITDNIALGSSGCGTGGGGGDGGTGGGGGGTGGGGGHGGGGGGGGGGGHGGRGGYGGGGRGGHGGQNG